MMANETLKISDIKVPKGKRRIDSEVVNKIAHSVIDVGLLHPIIVSKDMNLIAGQHRLEAYKQNKEVLIEARVVDITFDDDMVATIELDENDSRAELDIRDKVALLDEIKKRRDDRVKNGGHDTRKTKVGSIGTTLVSKEEVIKKSKIKRTKEAKEAGFKNLTESKRVGYVVKRGVDELVEALNKGEVSVSGAEGIAKLPKDEQKLQLDIALKKNGKVNHPKSEEKNTVEVKKLKLKEQDKHGAYVNIKVYTSDIKRTADNIAQCFGKGFESVYSLLLHEMMTSLSRNKNRDADLSFNSYSYGSNSLSDGEIVEIKELIATGMHKKDIEELYNISNYLVKFADEVTIKDTK